MIVIYNMISEDRYSYIMDISQSILQILISLAISHSLRSLPSAGANLDGWELYLPRRRNPAIRAGSSDQDMSSAEDTQNIIYIYIFTYTYIYYLYIYMYIHI